MAASKSAVYISVKAYEISASSMARRRNEKKKAAEEEASSAYGVSTPENQKWRINVTVA